MGMSLPSGGGQGLMKCIIDFLFYIASFLVHSTFRLLCHHPSLSSSYSECHDASRVHGTDLADPDQRPAQEIGRAGSGGHAFRSAVAEGLGGASVALKY